MLLSSADNARTTTSALLVSQDTGKEKQKVESRPYLIPVELMPAFGDDFSYGVAQLPEMRRAMRRARYYTHHADAQSLAHPSPLYLRLGDEDGQECRLGNGDALAHCK